MKREAIPVPTPVKFSYLGRYVWGNVVGSNFVVVARQAGYAWNASAEGVIDSDVPTSAGIISKLASMGVTSYSEEIHSELQPGNTVENWDSYELIT